MVTFTEDILYGSLHFFCAVLLIWICKATNAELDKYKYIGYDIGFDSRSEFSLPDGSMEKNVIISGPDMSSSVHDDNKNKDILILGEELTQGLDFTTVTAEAKYPISFTPSGKRFVLSLYYNGSSRLLFVNATKIYQFEAKTHK